MDFEKIFKKNQVKRYVQMVLGVFICALTYNLFIMPNNIVFGGLGGLNIIIQHFVKIPSSIFILVCSLVLCFFSYIFLSKESTTRSVIGALLFPLFVEMTSNIGNIIVIDSNDVLLLSLFGGIVYGIGMGLIMKSGFTLGGTDIISQILSKYGKLTMGNAMLIVEGVIVLIGAFIFGLTNCLYAIIILYLITLLVDRVMLGISDKKAFYIITKSQKKVCDYVINELGHTITVFSATGGFSKRKVSVLFTVIPTKEFYKLKEGISKIDNEAFFTVVDAYEVAGGN